MQTKKVITDKQTHFLTFVDQYKSLSSQPQSKH